MRIGILWRIAVYLKKLTVIAHSIADSLATLARIEQDRWEQETVKPKVRPMVFGKFNAEEAAKYEQEKLLRGE